MAANKLYFQRVEDLMCQIIECVEGCFFISDEKKLLTVQREHLAVWLALDTKDAKSVDRIA